MTLRFAVRPRIRLRDEPAPSRALRVSPLALPIASYWAIMGVLTYGVASGVLRPERLASLHVLPRDSFTSSRLVPPLDEPANVEAAEQAPQAEPAVSSLPAPSSAPLAVAAPAAPTPGSTLDPEPPAKAPKPAVRPLSGFSLIAPIQDDDGDRGPYAPAAAEDRELAAAEDVGRHAAPAPSSAITTREPSRARAVFEPRERELEVPMPSEWKPVARGNVALRAPERDRGRALAMRRENPEDPYPGYRDDDAPSRALPVAPEGRTRDVPEEKPLLRPPPSAGRGISSCEAVLATANEEVDLTKSRGAPDLTRGAYASVLEHGRYLLPCSVPTSMTLDVCAAVRDGHAVGVTVVSHPSDARVSACVRNAVAGLPFPKSSRLDVTRTHFGAAR